jgi:hypothetical protein
MARTGTIIGAGLTASLALVALEHPVRAQTVPTDPQPTCAISAPAFNAMFESGTVTLNGVVKPADSTLVLNPNCPFFTWSEQMYLWMTSPAPSRYGGGSRIMFSPTFYTVSPADANGRRDFIQNKVGVPIRMMLRTTELGPHLLPALLTRTGQVVEVARPDPRKPVPAQIRLLSGALVPLSDVRVAPNRQLQFFSAGKPVVARKLALPMVQRPMVMMANGQARPMVPVAAMQNAIQARKLVFHGIPVFIDSSNNVIDVEPGQADGGVLLSQGNSLIYYISVVNDVFAYHRTMQGPAVIPFGTSITFPMTMADANAVKTFAAAHGHTIVDPEALAIESKSSWIEASAVPNPNDYVSVNATVPTFDKSNPNKWVPNGQHTIKLVMVGIHVVGSTNGHGEMVWGSFEHVTNAPNAAYSYNSTSGPKTVAQNTAGSWLFTPSGSAGPFNGMNASWDTGTGNIVGTPVAKTPVLRMRPWGMPGSNASSNTQVISSNASVIAQLIAGDVRRNYFQIGTTWTINGQPPNSGNQVGTNQLANATIETFMQASSPTSGTGSNCFTCHQSNKVSVSHSYPEMNPLF